MRLDWMDQRAQLASDRVRAQLAETELRRTQELFNEKIVTEALLDAARSAKESLEARSEGAGSVSHRAGKAFGRAELGRHAGSLSCSEVVARKIFCRPRSKSRSRNCGSPRRTQSDQPDCHMDGMVSTIHHRSGEAILAGEPIVTLTALKSDRSSDMSGSPWFSSRELG